MSTGPERVADAVIDLVARVGIEGAAVKLSQLARSMKADNARELAKRWAVRRSLTPAEALSIGRAAMLRNNGIDCLTVCPVHPREQLASLQARGLMTSTMCQPCDGDGWSTGDDEVEGWELTELGTPLNDADRERLFAWVRERCEVERLACEDESRAAWCLAADIALANELGLEVAQAKALREAAEWPS